MRRERIVRVSGGITITVLWFTASSSGLFPKKRPGFTYINAYTYIYGSIFWPRTSQATNNTWRMILIKILKIENVQSKMRIFLKNRIFAWITFLLYNAIFSKKIEFYTTTFRPLATPSHSRTFPWLSDRGHECEVPFSAN